MRFEVGYGDSFRASYNLGSYADINEAYKFVLSELYTKNMDSPLVMEDILTKYKCYFPLILDKNEKNMFPKVYYAGKNGFGKHCLQQYGNPKELIPIDDNYKVKIFIGKYRDKDQFAHSGITEISSLESPYILDRDFYFIKSM